MGAEPPGPSGPMESVPVGEKPAALASAVADVTTKEEQAQQDAKLRPEREAKLGDYIVSISLLPPLSSLEAVANL